ncbi:hypothetical protein DYB32_001811 [Aphanomyces invadans]|nr:hypothetical protein DYB32_001811 [Aphanomyces invadans]
MISTVECAIQSNASEALAQGMTGRKHRKYRANKKLEKSKLRQRLHDLENVTQGLIEESRSRTAMLSWRSIAVALKDSRDMAHRRNRVLRAKIHLTSQFLREVDAWFQVHACALKSGVQSDRMQHIEHTQFRRLSVKISQFIHICMKDEVEND